MIDYPISRLQGAVDAGATFELAVSGIEGQLRGKLESKSGARFATAVGPDLATVASNLMLQWLEWFPGPFRPPEQQGAAALARARRYLRSELRPHMRAALGELGACHGRKVARGEKGIGYRCEGCECDYCLAFDAANEPR